MRNLPRVVPAVAVFLVLVAAARAQAPSITSLSPNAGPVGTSVTIVGTSFGASQGTSTVTFRGPRGFGNPIATPTSWSDTGIVVPVPNGAITGNVTVAVGGVGSNGTSFTVLTPSLTSISPSSGPAGTAVTLTGTNFGPSQQSSTVIFNGSAATALSWSNTSIVALVPSGSTSGLVAVSNGVFGSNGIAFTVPLVVNNLSPNTGTAGSTVNIFGSSFGNTQGSSIVMFNGVATTATSWSDSAISATVPNGATSGSVVVAVGGQLSNGVSFTVPPPSLSSLSRGAAAVGASINIAGSSFGASQGTSTVTFNGTPAVPTSWSDSSINVPVPSGATSGNVVVTVAGQVSNGLSFTPGPSIQSVSLTGASAGTPVTMSGASFGSSQNGSVLQWNGTTVTPSSWSDGSITFVVPSLSPGSGNLVVTVGALVSNSASFNVVSGATVSPTSGAVGTAVTITGTNFGATQGTSTVTFNGNLAAPSSWGNTSITVPVPGVLPAGNVTVTATVGSVGTSGSFNVTPAISSLSPIAGVVGTSVTIKGTGFGSSQGASTVQFNGATATVTNWTNTSITAAVPSGAFSGNVVVTVGNLPSNGVFFSFGPIVQTLSPTWGPIGTPVTINGLNFGATQGTSFTQWNGSTLTPTSWSDTSITTTVPNVGIGTGNVVVFARGLFSSGVPFTIVPNITLSPANAPVGTAVTISGTNFGATQGTSTVTFSGITATPASWSNASIVVPVPNGLQAGNVTVVVTVGGVANSAGFTLLPNIANVSPVTGVAGASVTITGTNFGPAQGNSLAVFGSKVGTPTSWSDTSITVPVPSGASSGNVVVVVAGNYDSNGVPFTVLVPPNIISIDNSSLAVGALLGITGSHFGASQGSSTITFNGMPGTPSSWSDTQLGVPVPIGATPGNVVVTVAGLASNGVTFTPGPSIQSLSSNWAPVGIGPVPATVTISGANFGATQGTSFVLWNGFTMTPSSWSNSSIVFPVPNISTGTGNVVVYVHGVATNGVPLTVVPAITVSPSSGPLGTPVTITGTNFGATQGSSTVTLKGLEADTTAWSNTSISTAVPNGVPAGNQNLLITVGGVVNSVVFGVTPSIKSLSPTAGVIGTSVTISGTSFGATQGSSTVFFASKVATPTNWSDTQIVVPVPSGTTTGPVVVTVGLSSNGVTFTVSGAPVLNTFSPGSGVVGTGVTLTGANFGATQGSSTVTFNGTAAAPTSWSNTQILVPVPAGATSGNIVVTVAGAPSNPKGFIVNSSGPTIQSILPIGASPGTPLTITGNNFGATQGTSVVQWNGFTVIPTSWSNTSITAKSPNAPTGPGFMEVTVGGTTSNGVSFAVVPPLIISPSRGSVGTSIAITGTGFGTTQGTSTVAINGTAVTPTSWSNTSITVTIPAGIKAGTNQVAVTVGGIIYSGTFEVVPAITSISPVSGAVGATVTITGSSFGATQGTSQVTFDAAVATPSSWSDTSITVPVPGGAITGNIVVTVAGLPSNGVHFTVTPGISLSPASGPVGTVVTITGTNLGLTQGSSTIAFNGTSATATSWSSTQIVTSVPSGATTGPVVVTVGGLQSNGVNFTVTPAIASLSPASGNVGASVTITGTTFGSTQGSSTVTFNGAAATPTSWSSTKIVVPVPSAATTGSVIVTVAGNASNPAQFTVVPVISSISPSSGPVNTSIAISGTGFGSAQGSSTVTFNGTLVTPTSWSASSIVVSAPAGLSAGAANVVVTVNGVPSNGGTFTVTPTVTVISPGSGPVGTLVAITGTNFGVTQGNSTVTIGGVAVTPGSWSNTSITVTVPTLPVGAASVVVTINGVTANPGSFAVTPGVGSLSPNSGSIGTSVTIAGTSFGATQGSSTVTFNGIAASPTSWSDTQIVVPVPSGATSGNVVVTISSLASNGVAFTVAPTISSLSPSSGSVSTSVTITGANFGASQGASTVTFNGVTASPTSWSSTQIVVPVPNGAHTGNLVVTVNGLVGNGVTFTVTGVPSITGLSPASGATGSTVTITGTGFGATQGVSAVFFNGTLATSITSWSDTGIAAVVPTGATSGFVTVIVANVGSNSMFFAVADNPVLKGLTQFAGPVGMGFTVLGQNFGNSPSVFIGQTQLTVLLNGVPSGSTCPTGLSCITVQIPPGTPIGKANLVVTVGTQTSNPASFSVIAPYDCVLP